MADSPKSRNAQSDYYGSDKVICRNIIVPKRPLEIIEYISKEDAILEAKLQKLERELADVWNHKQN